MSKHQATVEEFCSDLRNWYDVSTYNEYWVGWNELLDRLPEKAETLGYFDVLDLCAIADWGGNQHGIKQQMQSRNTPDEVKQATSLAITQLDNPAGAMRAIVSVNYWGVSYGSKTLTFMRPTEYAILDSWIQKALEHVIPRIHSYASSVARGYVSYLKCCRELQTNVAVPPPVATTNGQWRIADIGQALFEFARSGGVLTPQ